MIVVISVSVWVPLSRASTEDASPCETGTVGSTGGSFIATVGAAGAEAPRTAVGAGEIGDDDGSASAGAGGALRANRSIDAPRVVVKNVIEFLQWKVVEFTISAPSGGTHGAAGVA